MNYSKKSYIIIILLALSILLPIIHSEIFRYKFDDTKFALYDIGSSLFTLYYFYNKKSFNLSLLNFIIFSLIFFMILSMIQSVNIVYSVEYLFRFFNTIILIAFIYQLLNKKLIIIEYLLNIILLSASIFSLYYLYGAYIINIFNTKNSFSPIGHINYTAHVLNIWIPLLLLNIWIQKNKFFKYLSLIILLLLINILLFSASRASILGLIVSEFTVLIFLIKKRQIILYPLITLSIIFLFFTHKLYKPNLLKFTTKKVERISKFKSKQSFRYKLNRISSGRVNIYSNTFDMILDNPWGVGIGNFEYIHPLYAKAGTAYKTPHVNEKNVFTNPHNIIMKFLSELGWIGGFIFVSILIVLMKMTIKNTLKGDKIDHMIAIAFGANLFNSMLSAVFLTATNIFFTTFLLAIIIYRYYTFTTYKTLFKIKKIYFKPLLLIIPLFFSIFFISKYYTTQFSSQRNFNYINKAIIFNPFNQTALLRKANYEAYANKDYPLAIKYMDKFLKLYPYNIGGLLKKSKLEYRARYYQSSLKTIDRLLHIDKNNKKAIRLKNIILNKHL